MPVLANVNSLLVYRLVDSSSIACYFQEMTKEFTLVCFQSSCFSFLPLPLILQEFLLRWKERVFLLLPTLYLHP